MYFFHQVNVCRNLLRFTRVINDCVSYELGRAGIFKPTDNDNLHKTYNDNVLEYQTMSHPDTSVVNEVNVVSSDIHEYT